MLGINWERVRLFVRPGPTGTRKQIIRNRLEWLLRQVYGRKTEKQPEPEQPMLFDAEGEENAQSAREQEAVVTVERQTRKKATRKALPQWLPREEVIIDIDEADKQCACGHAMVRIGEETSEKLDVIPAQFTGIPIAVGLSGRLRNFISSDTNRSDISRACLSSCCACTGVTNTPATQV